ncbi:diphthamide biosynthesis protein [Daldinia caldariorum]|uniref:diphthamide biosynthesis protein n=1 Tax=Daldinia caldariorum TaxID=326644 RepID=UPI002007D42A|nr:diphthamide biosynthesis protein [Daldinia caldariorum]KAI1463245.1 diphthamide biosynthesis protein [Daldinia caldariorum]
MTSELSAPPILSTPAEHTFNEDPTSSSAISQPNRPHRSDRELYEVYEIARTASEIQQNGWNRVALQFPDAMLPDAPWVVGALGTELRKGQAEMHDQNQRLYILADTSYSACCVDEIAAEHADADGVVHYGRACLSPTSRLPVIHIFTRQALDYDAVFESFEREFPERAEKVVLMADVMFQEHVEPISKMLEEKGYANVIATEILRDPTGTIPNRKLITSDTSVHLNEYHLFHISTPPTSLLLTLSSRLSSLRIYPTPSSPYTTASEIPDPSATPGLLRRRYALVIRFATASIIGILVNTLSVKNYMSTISTLKNQIAAAGKKSYTIVVGKLNAAKLANFAEVDGWVVVGCWESGLVEQEGLWKPVITPFELALALQGDESRVWTGEWWGGIEGVKAPTTVDGSDAKLLDQEDTAKSVPEEVEGGVDDEESEPPEFDLRTGKLISHSRPMRVAIRSAPRSAPEVDAAGLSSNQGSASSAVAKRVVGDIALVNGVASPGAEFLRSQRTWQGLGTDFNARDEEDEEEESAIVEEGRSGVARGYTVGEDELRT